MFLYALIHPVSIISQAAESSQPSHLLALLAKLQNRIYELCLYNNGYRLQYYNSTTSSAYTLRLLEPVPATPPKLSFPMQPAFNQL